MGGGMAISFEGLKQEFDEIKAEWELLMDKRITCLNPDNLDQELAEQPGWVDHVGWLHARAQRLSERWDLYGKRVWARNDGKIRTSLSTTKITEVHIKSMLQADEAFSTIELFKIESNYLVNAIRNVMDAMRHKKDMLREISFNQRELRHVS